MDPDLPCLETFVILAERGSFSETAAVQKISQPAVSQRIAKLESATGLRLFRRTQESLTPTREGQELLEIARRIVAEHEMLGIRMSRHVREMKGIVRVMIDRSLAGARIEEALLLDETGENHVEIAYPDPARDWSDLLEQRQIDIVVTGTFLPIGQLSGLQRVELECQQGTTLAWNRVYFDFDAEKVRFPEILRSAILVPSERLIPGYLRSLERWCTETYGILPPDLIAFDDEFSAREACLSGLGVLVFPGEADLRMQIGIVGLGIAKTRDFLLPEVFSYSIYLRAGETTGRVLDTALQIKETYRSQPGERGVSRSA